MKHKPTPHHNYLVKIDRMRRDGMFPPGTVGEIDIRHDDWCDVYTGGYCNCDPGVSLRNPKKP